MDYVPSLRDTTTTSTGKSILSSMIPATTTTTTTTGPTCPPTSMCPQKQPFATVIANAMQDASVGIRDSIGSGCGDFKGTQQERCVKIYNVIYNQNCGPSKSKYPCQS
jgi:hypothetical protein